MNDAADLAIVGAGAAGLATAISAAERRQNCRIVVLDGAKTIGAKILVSGGGRCNLTHEQVNAADFFGNRRIIKNVLAAFPVQKTLEWFASMGVALKKEETGKLFPETDKARTVLDALTGRCRELGVEIHAAHRVTAVDRQAGEESGFVLRHERGRLFTTKLVLATGGRSLPKSGSDGSGYELARRFGHRVTATAPALVPLVLDERMFHRTLSGLSQEVELISVVDGRSADRRIGSLLWTHFGISGPVAMDASRFWTVAQVQGRKADLFCNFFPGCTGEDTREWLMTQTAEAPRQSLVKIIARRLPERFAEAMCSYAHCDPTLPMGQCPRERRERLAQNLSRFHLPIERDRGWSFAEATAGGVPLEEIDYRTMESRVVPGLYLAGEILDCDGRIGGFNFQWAWATGFLAGKAVSVCDRH
jgi:hypothetical protein